MGNGIGIIRQQMVISGHVQGVGFRYRANHAANALGITGYVKNNWDGTVTLEAQGTIDMINKMLTMINRSEYIDIDRIDRKEMSVVETERGFHIR